MSDYGTMVTRIADELVNEPISAAQTKAAIQTAIKHYQREAFWFNEKVGSFSTVTDQEWYAAADYADIPYMLRVDTMRVGPATSMAPLKEVPHSAIEDIQDGSMTGEPQYWARYQDKIRFMPIPNDAYTITLSYIYRLAALSADSDTNAWVDECEEMIRQSAKRILCTDILHADDMAQRYAELERVAYDRIRSENRQRRAQTLRVDWPFNRGYLDLERSLP